MRLKPENIEALVNFITSIPYHQYIGLRIDSIEDGKVTLSLNAANELANNKGHIHGAILSALVDSAGASAIRTFIGHKPLLSTIELVVNYLEPAFLGEIYGEGKVMRVGKTIAVAEVDIRDSHRKLLAKGLVSFKVFSSE